MMGGNELIKTDADDLYAADEQPALDDGNDVIYDDSLAADSDIAN